MLMHEQETQVDARLLAVDSAHDLFAKLQAARSDRVEKLKSQRELLQQLQEERAQADALQAQREAPSPRAPCVFEINGADLMPRP